MPISYDFSIDALSFTDDVIAKLLQMKFISPEWENTITTIIQDEMCRAMEWAAQNATTN